MRIAYDTQSIFSEASRHRGVGNYTVSHLRGLIVASPTDEHILFNIYGAGSALDALWPNGDAPAQVREFTLYMGEENEVLNCTNEENLQTFAPMLQAIVKRFLRENEIELFYFTSVFEKENIFNINWYEGVRTAATVFDVIPYLFPWLHFNSRNEKEAYMEKIEFLRHLDKLLVISQSVKDDLLTIPKFDAGKIEVIYAGIDAAYRKIAVTNEVLLRQKYGINGKFILCSGGATPRKNMQELTEAFSYLPKNLIEGYMLVLVCKMDQHWINVIQDAARKGNVEERVICTGFVPFEDLLALYNMANLMAFPSQYEGFGLPVIEAMACGCPVLTSNNSSLGEIAKDAAVLVNPFSIEDITRGLQEALGTDMREKYSVKMAEKVKTYTWQNTINFTKMAFADLERALTKKDNPNARQTRLAVFTPLPPMESGIADYCQDVLNAMAPLCKSIDVFVDDRAQVDCSLAENIRVFSHEEYPARCADYAQTLYHVGNNAKYHTYMIPYVQKYHGIVVLHDTNVNGFLMYKSITVERDERIYKKYYLEDFPDEANSFIEGLGFGYYYDKYANVVLNGAFCNYADKIITHSEYGRVALLNADPMRDVEIIRHYAAKEEEGDRRTLRKKYDIPQEAYVFAAFGFITTTKGIDKALEAFAEVRKKHTNVFFLLAGEADAVMKKTLHNLELEHHFGDSVRVTGFIEIEEFKDYIRLCDVCVNLRFPYNGETSGSFMRVLGAGKPAIVNDIGSFSEVPDECVTKIKVCTGDKRSLEVGALEEAFLHYIEDRDFTRQQGRAALAYAEKELDLNKIARQYVNCAIAPVIRSSLTRKMFDSQFSMLFDKVVATSSDPKEMAIKLVPTVSYAAGG